MNANGLEAFKPANHIKSVTILADRDEGAKPGKKPSFTGTKPARKLVATRMRMLGHKSPTFRRYILSASWSAAWQDWCSDVRRPHET